ncbi:MAG: hemolysin III family protein [Candidatus Cryptobacteroides sp.]
MKSCNSDAMERPVAMLLSYDESWKFNEEKANSLTHLAGTLICLAAGMIFIDESIGAGSAIAVFSFLLYLFGGVSSYLASTIYHAWPLNEPRTKAKLRKIDHAAIYWHIAGSYSPITLITMCRGDSPVWGWSIFAFVWLCAIAGSLISFRKMKLHSYFKTVCYVLMGLSILVAFKPFYQSAGLSVLLWVVAEGVCYISGAVFYSIYRRRYMHTVFHLLVIAGDLCHIVALWKVLQLFVL